MQTRWLLRHSSEGNTLSARSVSPAPEILETLLVSSSRGDAEAFADLYDAVAPRVHGLVLRVLRDVHQSEEVTQEVLLELWQTSARFDPARGTALTWVLTLAHRRAVDRVRSSEAWRRRDSAHAERAAETPYDETATAAHASLEAIRVRTALGALAPAQRDAIRLAYFGGYTYIEVSRVLQIPLGTAKSRIRDGLSKLRDALSAEALEAV